MPASPQPTYLVNTDSDPVVIRVVGRASYLNVAPLNDFLAAMQKQKRRDIVFDMEHCAGMDSTFLGLLTGLALDVRQAEPAGSVVVCRLSPRNLELIRNLGLHRLLEVDAKPGELAFKGAAQTGLSAPPPESEAASARLILRAHECLCAVDDGNRARFSDVITILRHQVESERDLGSSSQ